MTTEPIWEMTVDARRGVDRDEVRRALALLVDPDATHEARGLPSGRSRAVRGWALDEAVGAVESLADDRGVYLTLNPVRPDLGDRAASVKDVVARRHLLVDCDRAKREGAPDENATDAEKLVAWELCQAVHDDLAGRGWPGPIVADSGNGYHLIYSVDLPNDPLSRQLLKACLKAVGEAHTRAGAAVDLKVYDAPRIVKLPGTWVRKGAHTDERPHRLARLVAVPTAYIPVPAELLRALAGVAAAEGDADPAVWQMTVGRNGGAGSPHAYVRKAVEDECGKVALAPAGDRNNALNRAAFALGTLLHLEAMPRAEVELALAFAARRAGLVDREVAATVRSGLDAGEKEPREVHLRNGHTNGAAGGHAAAYIPGASSEPTTGKSGRVYPFPLVVRGSSVAPKRVRWLWRDRIPFAFLTLMAGRTGVGKSFVTLDVAARLTVGGEVPLGGGECFDPSPVLVISEDSTDYLLAPRLIEMGADMRQVAFMTFEAMAAFTLSDTQMLDDAYEDSGAPRLVVIDPPTNFLGAKDEHRNAEVRGVLMGCSVWAMRHDIAVVMITHTNKGTKKDIGALDRIIGSVAWASTSRIAHLLAPHPDRPGESVFLPMKSNIGRMPPGLAYAIEPTEALARVRWVGVADVNADDAVTTGAPTRKATASDWLAERFGERREWGSEELFDLAHRAGISRNAIFEAKNLLRLPKARPEAGPDGARRWVWWVPPDWQPP